MTKEERKARLLVLRDRAARLHYHGTAEIRLTEDEFATAFISNWLVGNKTTRTSTDITWYFSGLKVVRKEMTSRAN